MTHDANDILRQRAHLLSRRQLLGRSSLGLGAVIAALPQPRRREVARPLVEAPATVGD